MGLKDRLRSWGREHALPYVVSLPERAVRSASAVTGGLVREVADIVVPVGVRRGRVYKNMVDATLRFLIEQVGQVNGVYPAEERLSEDFLVRRTAGNGIELMGILAFRASPVWILAALADVCGLGRQLIPEITQALKAEGLLEQNASFTTVEQMLNGLERTAGRLAETINAPPLDIASLRQEWLKFREEVGSLPVPALPSASSVTRLWSDLRNEAVRQNRSVFELSSLMAVSAVGSLPERARRLSVSAMLVAGKSGSVVSSALLDHYRNTLQEIRRVGYVKYAIRQLGPYVRAALGQFSPRQKTITGRLLKK